MNGDRLLTVKETADRLRVRAGWIYGHVHAGTLPFPFVKVGRYIRIKESILEQYVETSTQPALGAPQVRRVR